MHHKQNKRYFLLVLVFLLHFSASSTQTADIFSICLRKIGICIFCWKLIFTLLWCIAHSSTEHSTLSTTGHPAQVLYKHKNFCGKKYAADVVRAIYSVNTLTQHKLPYMHSAHDIPQTIHKPKKAKESPQRTHVVSFRFGVGKCRWHEKKMFCEASIVHVFRKRHHMVRISKCVYPLPAVTLFVTTLVVTVLMSLATWFKTKEKKKITKQMNGVVVFVYFRFGLKAFFLWNVSFAVVK